MRSHACALPLHPNPCAPSLSPPRLCEMLGSTSLMAYVGAGEQPTLTQRKLTIFNTATSQAIQDLSFASSVLAVCMNKQRCVLSCYCMSASLR